MTANAPARFARRNRGETSETIRENGIFHPTDAGQPGSLAVRIVISIWFHR